MLHIPPRHAYAASGRLLPTHPFGASPERGARHTFLLGTHAASGRLLLENLSGASPGEAHAPPAYIRTTTPPLAAPKGPNHISLHRVVHAAYDGLYRRRQLKQIPEGSTPRLPTSGRLRRLQLSSTGAPSSYISREGPKPRLPPRHAHAVSGQFLPTHIFGASPERNQYHAPSSANAFRLRPSFTGAPNRCLSR